MRKIGMDFGTKSCGISISDPLNITAQGLESLEYSDKDYRSLSLQVIELILEYGVDVFVVGRPTFPSGDKTKTELLIDEFISEFKLVFKNEFNKEIKIVFINENNTTKKAKEVMRQANMSERKMRIHKDKLSAQLILQDYLAFV